ncbi:ankyrin repeat domain-containing protein 26 isoform X5 [Xenopus tropicalis]|uniref:Ankyrin repeat domain-containing protein 26 isoform X5 n=1 Tax=Xenopus tropicalis TaxID=8364 RepID=A0A8J1JDW7_XENTR|nr:ankyrin repeat domain-containing protein 26 isoform X5 [Xenopus tropicalis]
MKKIFGFGKKKKWGPSPNTSDTGSVLSVGYELKDKDLSKLHRAASAGDVGKIKQLIKKQDINQLDKENRTPLHIACANGQLDTVKVLLEHKSKLNLCDNDNRSPLLKAIQCQQESCATVLLEHNADPNLVDINGNAALHLAALIPSVSIAKQLLEHGANINAFNKEGCTPLILAVTENNEEMVEFLLKEGADINACDRGGRTSLMISSNNGQNNLVRILLQNEADINIKDEKSWTADDYGVMNGHHACSHLIIEHGSKKRVNMSPCYGSIKRRETSIFNTPSTTGEAGCALASPATNKNDSHSQEESESCISGKSGDVDSWPSSDEDNDDLDFCPQKTPKPSLTQLLKKKKHALGNSSIATTQPVGFTLHSTSISEDESLHDSRDEDVNHQHHPKPFSQTPAFPHPLYFTPGSFTKPPQMASSPLSTITKQDSSNADDENDNSDFEESVESSPFKANMPSLNLSGETTYSEEKLQDVGGPGVRKVELMSELGLEEDDIESPWDSESASESSRKQVVSDLPLPAAKTQMQCISEESNEDVSYRPSFLRPSRSIPEHDVCWPESQSEFSEKSAVMEPKKPKLGHETLQKCVSSSKSVAKGNESALKPNLMDDLGLDDADDIEDASDWDSASLSPKYTMPHQRNINQVQNTREETLPRAEAPLPISSIIPPVPIQTVLKPNEDGQSTASEDEFNSTNNAIPEIPNCKEDSLKEKVENNTLADQKENKQYENSKTQSEQLKQENSNMFAEEAHTVSEQCADINQKLGSAKGMQNIMHFGNNTPSNGKVVLDGKLSWKQKKNTINGDPLEVFDDSTLSDTSQEDDGRYDFQVCRTPGKFTSKTNKLDNAGELEDFSPSSDTATEEYGTPTLPFRNAKMLIEQLGVDSQDSVNLLKFQNIIHEYERTIQRENGRYKLLASKVKKMENEKKDLQQIAEKNRELKSMLDHQKVESESDLNSLRFTLKQEEEKRKNAEMLYGKSQEQLRRKEDQCCQEMEAKQLLELTIRNLELEMRSMQNTVRQVEEERNEVQRLLSHEHNARIAQEDILNNIRRKSEEIENEKMWTKNAEVHGQLSKIDEREKDLILQNSNLQEEMNVLKLELDHVRSQNQQEESKYMDENENLKEKIADLRRDLKMNEETLTQTVIQYNSQLHALKTENTMLCSKLEHEKQGKDRLETELESIRSRLTSTLQEVERNQALKIEVERTLQRERDEWLRSQDKLNHELSTIRENNNNLSQQLIRAETKSNSLENELRQTNTSLQDKVILSESTQRELTHTCGRIKELEHTLQLEKDKICKSTVKQESLQEKLAQIQSENMLLRQQIEDVNNKGIIKDKTVSDVQDKFTEIIAKIRADAERQVQIIEERNKDLIIKYNETREQLYRLETEKVERESTLRQLQQELADALKKLSMSEASLEVITRYRNDIEGEKQILQKEVEKFRIKVQDLEEQCNQAERLHHQLKNLLEDKEREVMAVSQKVQEYSSAAAGDENAIKELEGHVQKLEIENAKFEATAKQQAGQIDILQKELRETLSIRHKLEELIASLQSSKMGLEEKLNHQVHKQTALSQSAQDSHNLWEEELKSRSRLGIRLAELEHEKAEFADQVESEKKKVKKLIEHKRSMEARFDQEIKRNAELQRDISGLKKLLKTAKKKIKELESVGTQQSTQDGFKSTHFEKEIDIMKLKEKINELSFRLENESSNYKQLEAANRDLQQQLSSMKMFHKSQEHLEKGKRQLEDEVANLKRQIEINKVDQSLIEKHKREIEERGRLELKQKLEEVNLFLQSQAASQETLEQIRAANDASVRNQMEHRIQELESDLGKIKNAQQENMLQRESTQTELERFKELYNEELKNRNSLALKLERSNERLADANAKLLNERQRTKSLIASSIMNGSLATSPVVDASSFGNFSNSGFRLGGSFLSSTANGMNTNRVENYLTKMQQELEKNITKELDQANAELESGSSARVSPVGSIAGSLRNLNVDQDPVSRATQQYLEVLKKNYKI